MALCGIQGKTFFFLDCGEEALYWLFFCSYLHLNKALSFFEFPLRFQMQAISSTGSGPHFNLKWYLRVGIQVDLNPRPSNQGTTTLPTNPSTY